MKKILTKTLVLLSGLLSILLIIEIILRIIGWGYAPEDHETAEVSPVGACDDKCCILCLGDSHTQGYGIIPDKSYPSCLEKMLNKGRRKYEVINKGIFTQNTSQALLLLEEQIEEYRPDIVIAITGGANHWNYYGYEESASGFLYDIKVYKLLKLILKNLSDIEGPDEEYENYIEQKKKRIAEKISIYKEKLDKAPDKVENYFNLGMINLRCQKYHKALEWFKKGIEVDPNYKNNYVFTNYTYTLFLNDIETAIEWLKSQLEIMPDNPELWGLLGSNYQQTGRIDEAMRCRAKKKQICSRGIKLRFDKISPEFLNDLEIRAIEADTSIQSVYTNKIAYLIGFFGYRMDDGERKIIMKNESKVSEWIESDLRRIVNTCNKHGVKTVLGCYAIKPERNSWSISASSVNSIIREIADEYSLPLIDNEKSFRAFGVGMRSLFTSAENDAHPNARGYEKMAVNAYKVLKESGCIGETIAGTTR